jgi:Mg2+-importing ATPase
MAVDGVVLVAVAIPFTPLAAPLGFAPLPAPFFLALLLMLIGYLVLVEIAKYWFYRTAPAPAAQGSRRRGRAHRLSRFSSRFGVPPPGPRRRTAAQRRVANPGAVQDGEDPRGLSSRSAT